MRLIQLREGYVGLFGEALGEAALQRLEQISQRKWFMSYDWETLGRMNKSFQTEWIPYENKHKGKKEHGSSRSLSGKRLDRGGKLEMKM